MARAGVNFDVVFNRTAITSAFRDRVLGHVTQGVNTVGGSMRSAIGTPREPAALRAARKASQQAQQALTDAEAAFESARDQVWFAVRRVFCVVLAHVVL